jgi:hypothetical protein
MTFSSKYMFEGASHAYGSVPVPFLSVAGRRRAKENGRGYCQLQVPIAEVKPAIFSHAPTITCLLPMSQEETNSAVGSG